MKTSCRSLAAFMITLAVITSPLVWITYTSKSASASWWPPGWRIHDIPADEGLPKPTDYLHGTKLIIYNAVPKSGSTTAREIFGSLQHQNNYRKVSFQESSKKGLTFVQTLTDMVKQSSRPILFACHHYWIDFQSYGLVTPPHIQVVREPVAQLISLYQYHMDMHLVSKREWNMTVEDCFSYQDQCPFLHKIILYSVFLPYFCTNCTRRRVAEEGGANVLNEAKQNIVRYHSVVAPSEEMAGFFELLEYMHPQYFTGIQSLFLLKKKSNVSKHRKVWPVWAQDILRKNFVLEIDLYKFITRRFHAHLAEARKLQK